MDDSRAKRNVELVSRGLRDAAEQCRQKATAAMTDKRLTDAERIEAQEALKQLANQMEAQARWWITGEGPCP
jgi:hypothetical protein